MVKTAQGKAGYTKIEAIRDRNGSMIKEDGEVMKQLKEYFDNIFERDQTMFDNELCDSESEISMDAIMNAIKIIKISKAAGYDRPYSEMIKGGGGVMTPPPPLIINNKQQSGNGQTAAY